MPWSAASGIHAVAAGDVHDGEEEVADLRRHALLPLAAGREQLGLELGDLLVQLDEDVRVALPVEAEVRGARGQAHGLQERRKRPRDAVERRGRTALFLALLALELLPLHADALGVPDRGLAEDVRVARDHLVVDALRDAREVEGAALLPELREKDDLEEEIAQLALQLPPVLARKSVENLVALLEKIPGEVAGRLFPVPRALVSEPFHERHESVRGIRISHARILPAFT